ncbi:MAG: hypothetical protein WC302_00515 [Candidatus Paceibacterota bacterium]|jgi:hypothetical protein
MFKKVATIAALILMIFAAASCGKAAGANVDIYNVDVAQFRTFLMEERYESGDVVVVTGTVISNKLDRPSMAEGLSYRIKLESDRKFLSFWSETSYSKELGKFGGVKNLKAGQKVSLQVKIRDSRFILSDFEYSGDTTELGDAKVVKIFD